MLFAQVAKRASRSAITSALRTARPAQRTFIVPTAARSADLVQEIYLRELRAYKPTPIKASDADAHVKAWRPPTPPTPPTTASLAAELPEYVAQEVEVESGDAAAATGSAETSSESDWFEEDPEEEVKH